MGTITLSMPEDVKKEMKEFSDINWSAVAREAIRTKIILLKEMDELLSKSKINERDSIELGRRLKKAVTKKILNGKK